MEDTTTCPQCQMGNAYFNGLVYQCPDCDYEWLDNLKNYSSSDYSIFDDLSELKVPFFRLEHGKIYDCEISHEKGIEKSSVIPLAFKKDSNLQFVMTNARTLFNKNPLFVKEIIKMEYDYIYNDGIRADYPSEYETLTVNCVTQDDGTILDYNEFIFFNFSKTDIL